MARSTAKKTKTEWQLQDAKAQFSELVRRAAADGPQWVTKQGKPTAVILSINDYERMRSPKHRQSLSEFLRSSPLTGAGIKFERLHGTMRDINL